jgi:hypothetical protein
MSSQEAVHASASSVTPGKGKGALDLGGSKGSERAGHRAGKTVRMRWNEAADEPNGSSGVCEPAL